MATIIAEVKYLDNIIMNVVTMYAFLNGVFKAAKVGEGGKTNDYYPNLPLYIRCNYYLWLYKLFSPYTSMKIIF